MTGGLILYEINKLVMQLSNVWERKNNSARYFNHRIAVCCYFLPLLQYMINIMFKEAKNYVGQTALTTWKRSRRLQELVGSRRRKLERHNKQEVLTAGVKSYLTAAVVVTAEHLTFGASRKTSHHISHRVYVGSCEMHQRHSYELEVTGWLCRNDRICT